MPDCGNCLSVVPQLKRYGSVLSGLFVRSLAPGPSHFCSHDASSSSKQSHGSLQQSSGALRVGAGASLCLWLSLATMLSGYTIPRDTSHLLAPMDPACAYMQTSPAPLHPSEQTAQQNYFRTPIPKVVHQIWFGDVHKMDTSGPQAWQKFAGQFGYRYRLWGEQDAQELEALMPAENFSLWQQYLRLRDYQGASDIVRLSLLAQLGGIYADVDIHPPSRAGELVDLAKLLPLENIVFVTEKDSRKVSDAAIFVCNGLMMSAQHHPLMQHLVQTVVGNVTAVRQQPVDANTQALGVHTMYLTGPFFVTRSLAGAFTVLPYDYALAYNMLR